MCGNEIRWPGEIFEHWEDGIVPAFCSECGCNFTIDEDLKLTARHVSDCQFLGRRNR